MDLFDLFAKITLDKSEYEQGLDDAEQKGKGFASKLGGGLKTAGKVAAAGLALVTTAAAGVTTALAKGIQETASYGDNVDKMSQKMGLSAQAYQEWDAIMQHSGTSIESLRAGMKTLANAVENNNDAFGRLGITQEQIADMSQEELFSATISSLQNVENETERTYLAGQLLGRGATELGALLNMSAEDTEAMRQRVHELGGVMSDEAVKASATFADNMQDLQTSISGVKRGITAEFLPGVNEVLAGFTSLIIGEEGAEETLSAGLDSILSSVDNILPRIAGIITNLGSALLSAAPKLLEVGFKLVSSLAQSLSDNAGMIADIALDIVNVIVDALSNPDGLLTLIDAAFQIISKLAEGLAENLPTLIPAVVGILIEIVNKLTSPENIVMLATAAIQLVMGLAQGLIAAIPQLIAAAPVLIQNLVTALVQLLPMILSTGIQLLGELVRGIINALPQLLSAAGQIISTVLNGLADLGRRMLEVGRNVVQGIWNGISGAVDWLKGKISGWVGNVMDFIKGLFGIHSPSRWAQDVVGKNLVLGLAEGIDKNTGAVYDAYDEMMKGLNDADVNVSMHKTDANGESQEAILADLRSVLNRLQAIEPGTLVGMIAPDMDAALGDRQMIARRRLA